jgi:F0F1-type ATP synthase membrane subunit b/b'
MEATAISIRPAELNLNPLSQIDPVVIVAVIVIFVVMFLLLRRLYVRPYLQVMEAREDLFSTARGQSAEGERITRESELHAEQVLSKAATDAEELRSAAQSRADAYRKEQLAQASLESSGLLEKGRAELLAVREHERASVQSQAIECVTVACTQLLGDVDAEAVESTVNRLMERNAH